ncbi:MAG: hypothetical protein KDK26_10960 [Roseivivax sp.]|nr:hypothetical protein [Roseivivax sp.]
MRRILTLALCLSGAACAAQAAQFSYAVTQAPTGAALFLTLPGSNFGLAIPQQGAIPDRVLTVTGLGGMLTVSPGGISQGSPEPVVRLTSYSTVAAPVEAAPPGFAEIAQALQNGATAVTLPSPVPTPPSGPLAIGAMGLAALFLRRRREAA